jgi:hypothetical protein
MILVTFESILCVVTNALVKTFINFILLMKSFLYLALKE